MSSASSSVSDDQNKRVENAEGEGATTSSCLTMEPGNLTSWGKNHTIPRPERGHPLHFKNTHNIHVEGGLMSEQAYLQALVEAYLPRSWNLDINPSWTTCIFFKCWGGPFCGLSSVFSLLVMVLGSTLEHQEEVLVARSPSKFAAFSCFDHRINEWRGYRNRIFDDHQRNQEHQQKAESKMDFDPTDER